jgi:hypothetical protein
VAYPGSARSKPNVAVRTAQPRRASTRRASPGCLRPLPNETLRDHYAPWLQHLDEQAFRSRTKQTFGGRRMQSDASRSGGPQSQGSPSSRRLLSPSLARRRSVQCRFRLVDPRLDEAIEVGDSMVAHVHQWGRGKGSGATVEQSHSQVWTVRDGKVVGYPPLCEMSDPQRRRARRCLRPAARRTQLERRSGGAQPRYYRETPVSCSNSTRTPVTTRSSRRSGKTRRWARCSTRPRRARWSPPRPAEAGRRRRRPAPS